MSRNGVIGDSSSILDERRTWPQHQSALQLLKTILSSPTAEQLNWLDIACGRGQLVSGAKDAFSDSERAKLRYVGFDGVDSHAKATERLASQLGFESVQCKVGEFCDLWSILSGEPSFDYITFTNTVHEVRPQSVAKSLCESFLHLAPNGYLFVYDMEYIQDVELGAVPWSKEDATRVIRSIMQGYGVSDYDPTPSGWKHTNCKGWSIVVKQSHLGIPANRLTDQCQNAISVSAAEMKEILVGRLKRCWQALESLTRYGTETKEEEESKMRLLNEFWAINRALQE